MLAARAYKGELKFRLEEIATPSINDTEVLIRNRASGITKGMLGLWRHHATMMPQLPSVLSYEIAGEVAAVGADVTNVRKGDRVLVHSLLSCGNCEYCLSGEDPDCPAAANMGHIVYGEAGQTLYERYHNGGLAEFVRAPASSIELLPPQVSYAAAARVVSLAITYRSLSRLNARPGATIAINGITGAFGAAAARLAPLFGISRVIGIARTEASLARVKALLPDYCEFIVLDSLSGNWAENEGLTKALRGRTHGNGVDGAVDFSPAGAAVIWQMVTSLRKGGTIVLSGGNQEPWSVPFIYIMHNQLTVRGSRGGGRNHTRAVLRHVASGQIDATRHVSHEFELPDINDAVRHIDERKDSPLFVAVTIP